MLPPHKMRKHPVIYGISLIFLSGLGFLALLYGLSSLTGNMPFFPRDDKVGIIAISGIISSSQEIVEQITEFKNDKMIKAVVIRIDSPGGGVASAQEIYSAIKGLKKHKKVVASLGSIAASGGYMVACAADKIVANPGTLTGSISAIMYFANAEELLNKIGLKSSVVKSGKYKDIGSPTREMTVDERSILQALVDDIFDQFLDVITQDRKIPKEEVEKIADGRVFSGRQAQMLKLIDILGDKDYAVNLAGQMAGIKGTPEAVYSRKKNITFWDYILQNAASTFAAVVKRNISSTPQGVNYIYEYGT